MSDTEQAPGGHTSGPWAVWEGHTQVYAVGPNTENEPGYMSGYRRPVCEMLEDTGNFDADDDLMQMTANAALVAAAPDLYAACEAAQQCITDFLEVYKRGCSLLVIDEAVKSLRDDALRLTKKALAKAEGETA